MYLIKNRFKKHTNIDVPIATIWHFLNQLWDFRNIVSLIQIKIVYLFIFTTFILSQDLIEGVDEKFTKQKDFELPQTEDWKQLIEEQRALIKKSDDENTGISN